MSSAGDNADDIKIEDDDEDPQEQEHLVDDDEESCNNGSEMKENEESDGSIDGELDVGEEEDAKELDNNQNVQSPLTINLKSNFGKFRKEKFIGSTDYPGVDLYIA